MKSRRTRQFHELYNALPTDVQRQADKAYALFKANPDCAGLNFKPVNHDPIWYSVRINLRYRAACKREEDGSYVWFWIGTHAEYDQLLKQR